MKDQGEDQLQGSAQGGPGRGGIEVAGLAASRGRPATGPAKIGLIALTGLAMLGAVASLAVIPLGLIMFLFDDTGIPVDQVAVHALTAAIPLPLFGAIAAASLWGLVRSARHGAAIAIALSAALALLLATIPDSRDAIAFCYGILFAH